mgnify:CR=1 FL=1
MKSNAIIIIFIFTLALFLTSILVYAAGSSTIPEETSTPTPTQTPQQSPIPSPTITPSQKNSQQNKPAECESGIELKERIKCRLENKRDEEGEIDYEVRIPEACRALKNPTACIALYKKVQQQKCYDLEGREKDKCFKTVIGMKGASLAEESLEIRAQKAREYMVLLLYDLEERIEDKYEIREITSEIASEIIALIEEIKQDILNNEKRSNILINLNELKQKWRAIA